VTPVRLTGRGRGVAAGGGALLIAGLWSDLTAVLAGGVFALALTAASLVAALLLRRRARVDRDEPPVAASVGDVVTTTATIGMPRSAPAAVVGGLVPAWGTALDGQPLVLLPPWRGPRRASRSFTCEVRGRYEWSQLTLHLPEPLGMAYAVVAGGDPTAFTVYPRALPLPGVALDLVSDAGGVPAGGRPRHGATGGGASDPIPRAYLPGDELRRMHWPATARAGEPMVRTDDHEPVRRSIVVLDCAPGTYRTDTGFERAVTAAASLALALLRAGHAVSLRTASGGLLTAARWQEGRPGAAAVLAALATVALGDDAASGQGGDATAPRWLITGSSGAPDRPLQPGSPVRMLATEAAATSSRPDGEPPDRAARVVWDGSGSLAASLRRAAAVSAGVS
jgi:uncharacterized protein (DUF58 family)